MMEDFLCFIGACFFAIGGYALLLTVIRALIWLTDVILLRGW